MRRHLDRLHPQLFPQCGKLCAVHHATIITDALLQMLTAHSAETFRHARTVVQIMPRDHPLQLAFSRVTTQFQHRLHGVVQACIEYAFAGLQSAVCTPGTALSSLRGSTLSQRQGGEYAAHPPAQIARDRGTWAGCRSQSSSSRAVASA